MGDVCNNLNKLEHKTLTFLIWVNFKIHNGKYGLLNTKKTQ